MLIARDYSRKSVAKVQQILHIRKCFSQKAAFFVFFYENIWSYQKKAVPLHSLSMRRQYGGYSSAGRASDCGSECRGFEPH